MKDVALIILSVLQMVLPIVLIFYFFLLRKRMKKIRETELEIMEDYLRHSREIAMSEFLRVNPDIDPVIFEEKKEPIVPKRDKPRHNFNHKGGDYFM